MTRRRSFLKQLALTGVSLSAFPLIGHSKSSNVMKDSIKKIRPLGFQWETLDPFLFCVHHEDSFPEGNEQLGPKASLEGRHIGQDFILKDGWRMYHGRTIPGFPGHPHRGFETITVVRKGLVDHADSTGASGRYGNGDVQWMTAGKGVQHSEMFPLLNQDAKNPLELFQIWLNLPKKSKMVEPHFKMFWKDQIPVIQLDAKGTPTGRVEVLAGKFQNAHSPSSPPDSWASTEDHYVGVFNITIEANQTIEIPALPSSEINRSIYFYEGEALDINGESIPSYHAVDTYSDMTYALKAGNSVVKVLILQGKPINEPVVQHGPFVMNTKQEIHEAFEEYHKTQFGGWPWERYDQVHDRNLGRFAIHADGKKEIKED